MFCDNNDPSCMKFCFFMGNKRRMRRKTESNLDGSMHRNLKKEFKSFQETEKGKRQGTDRKFAYYSKNDHNLSPKISLSKANNPNLD